MPQNGSVIPLRSPSWRDFFSLGAQTKPLDGNALIALATSAVPYLQRDNERMANEPPGSDILEQGGEQGSRRFHLPGWRPSRGAGVLAVAALAIGLAAGYAAGNRQAAGGAARPQPTVTASAPASSFSFAASPALFQDTGACSTQTGAELQLGVQVTNQSTEPIVLQTAKAVLPLDGLEQLTWQWGPCGALPNAAGQAQLILAASDSTWLTATFKVQIHCPGPLPVQFSVRYILQGHPVTASLPGFPDLSQVPYSGCPPPDTNSNVSTNITQTP